LSSRLSRLLNGLAVTAGVGAVLVGLSVFVEAWQASRAWAGSGEAQHAELPADPPLWLDDAGPLAAGAAPAAPPSPAPDGRLAAARHDLEPGGVGAVGASDALPVRASETRTGAPTAADLDDEGTGRTEASAIRSALPLAAGSPPPQSGPPESAPSPSSSGLPDPQSSPAARPSASPASGEVEVAEIDFRFLDPPEPGAHARLAVTVVNRADVPTGPIGVVLPVRWLQDFRVFGAVPDVVDDRAEGDAERRFMFAGVAPGERQTFELHVLAAAEEVDAPEVRVLLGDTAAGDIGVDAEIGRGRPRTVAPRPRPGPARAVAIPKLGVRAAVIPVPWEPPAFVVGQVQGTAAVSEGNTVLIGHLGGPWGDVFARLSQLRPGDEVVATSRGLEYRFVVSEIAVRPYDDVTATSTTATPRLTLMTCTGQWNILRQDYSHRLWIVAEPPELAQQTIKANAERAAQAVREAETAAAERDAHEAEVNATATAQAEPAGASAAFTEPPVSVVLPSGRGGAPTAPQAAAAPKPATAQSGDAPAVSEAAAAVASPSPDAMASPGAASEPDALEPLAPGLAIDAPTEGAPVSPRLAVRGRRTADAEPDRSLWLVVRAAVDGSRWYALDRPLAVDQRGTWAATVELGGPAAVRHELRVVTVDAAGDAALRRHAAEHPGQPLDTLPSGTRTGARVTVERR
jgi:hypothetical protein